MSEQSSILSLNDQEFSRLLKSRDHILIKFWAPWCQPCKALTPIFEQAAQRHTEVAFAQINVEEHPAIGARLGVRALPTIQFWNRGDLAFNHVGLANASELDKLIERLVNE